MNSLYLLILVLVPFLVPDSLKRSVSIGTVGFLSLVYGLVALGSLVDIAPLQDFLWQITPLGALFSLLFVVTFLPVLLLNDQNLGGGATRRTLFYCAVIMLFVSVNEVLLGFGSGLLDRSEGYGRIWPFIFSWELMSVSSFLLLLFEVRTRAHFHTAILYFLLMHVAFVFMLFGLLQVGGHGETLFGGGVMQMVPWVLIFVGLALKSATFPLHFWLPGVYSASNGSGSSMMSISATNMGLMGVVYTVYYTHHVYEVAMVLMVLGLLSVMYGAIRMVRSTKFMGVLSYSSIESLGVVLFGFGFSYFAKGEGAENVAYLAAIGSVLKMFSHAVAKSQMLSVCGGIAGGGGGNADISSFGGLIHRRPNGTLSFLGGGLAMVGLPVFGSFVAEFFLFLALFQGIAHATLSVVSVVAMVVVAVGLSSTIFNFVKILGVAFLGGRADSHKPESDFNRSVRAGQWTMLVVGTVGLWALGYYLLGAVGPVFSINIEHLEPLYTIYYHLMITVGVLVVLIGGLWGLRRYVTKDRDEKSVLPLGRKVGFSARPQPEMSSSVLTAESLSEPVLDMLDISGHENTPKPAVRKGRPGAILFRFMHKLTGSLALLHTGRISHYILHILWFMVLVLVLTLCDVL